MFFFFIFFCKFSGTSTWVHLGSIQLGVNVPGFWDPGIPGILVIAPTAIVPAPEAAAVPAKCIYVLIRSSNVCRWVLRTREWAGLVTSGRRTKDEGHATMPPACAAIQLSFDCYFRFASCPAARRLPQCCQWQQMCDISVSACRANVLCARTYAALFFLQL